MKRSSRIFAICFAMLCIVVGSARAQQAVQIVNPQGNPVPGYLIGPFGAIASPSPIPSVGAPKNISTASTTGVLYSLPILNNQATPAPVFVTVYATAASSVTLGTTLGYETYCPATTTPQMCYAVIPSTVGWWFPGSYSVSATTTDIFFGGSSTPPPGVTVFPLRSAP